MTIEICPPVESLLQGNSFWAHMEVETEIVTTHQEEASQTTQDERGLVILQLNGSFQKNCMFCLNHC